MQRGTGSTYGRCATCDRRTRLSTLTRNDGACRSCRSAEYVVRGGHAVDDLIEPYERRSMTESTLARAFVALMDSPERGRLPMRGERAIAYVKVTTPNDAHRGAYHYANAALRSSCIIRDRDGVRWEGEARDATKVGWERDTSVRTYGPGRGVLLRRRALAVRYGASPSQGDNASRSIVRTAYDGATATYAPRGTHAYGTPDTTRTQPLSGATRRATARLNILIEDYDATAHDARRRDALALDARIDARDGKHGRGLLLRRVRNMNARGYCH